MIYKDKLIKLREKNSLKQNDLAKIINVDRSVYGQYEREYSIIPMKHLNTICNYFDVSLDYIFSLTNIPNYNSKKEINKTLTSKRLKEFRKENNLTQASLANILNVGQTTIAGYERAVYILATPFLYTVCSKYKISADYLLGKIDNPKYLK